MGLRIRRWYCPKAHRTFALVPDFAATRVSGPLCDIEAAVLELESRGERGETVEGVARRLRPDADSQGALRWLRRRRQWVAVTLAALVGIAPELLAGCEPTLGGLRAVLGVDCALVAVREIAAARLAHLAAPVGFAALPRPRSSRRRPTQQAKGTDPPPRGA